jgi:hypothetical protein
MYRIEYEIKLNEIGRPYIDLPEDYENRPEDRFFAIELAKYVLQDVYNHRSSEFDEEAAKTIDISIRLLSQVGDEIAGIIWNQMKIMGEVAVMLDARFHIQVESFDELNKFSFSNYILHNNKIYEKKEGLKAFVVDQGFIYELQKDTENQLFWNILP